MASFKPYRPKTIEKKWQKFWQEKKTNQLDLKKAKKPFYNLMMFPYPSAEGMHIGGVYTFTGVDTFGRYMRMKGYDVFQPIGLDGFGIHSENYAMKIGQHIKDVSLRTEKNFYRQLHSIGNMYDWSRTVETYRPEYYRWTQWLFVQMFKKGLAYQKEAQVNWCPWCKTVLSDEQVIAGQCERCDSPVEKKSLKQWFFAITQYADRLLKNSQKKDFDWPADVKLNQQNWIGRSEGALIKFQITSPLKKGGKRGISGLDNGNQEILPDPPFSKRGGSIECFTTRPDTLFGATYLVIAPEHDLLKNRKSEIKNQKEVSAYVKKSINKSEEERKATEKEKTGVEVKGLKAINPATKKAIPIWVADYVLSDYGTGVIMAVPAHDERDWEFAKKFKLPIKQVVAPQIEAFEKTKKTLLFLEKISKEAEQQKVKLWLLGGLGGAFYVGSIYRNHDDLDLVVKSKKDFDLLVKIIKRNGFKKKEEKKIGKKLINSVYKNKKGFEIDLGIFKGELGMKVEDLEDKKKRALGVEIFVVSEKFIKNYKKKQLKSRNKEKDEQDLNYLEGKIFTGSGTAVNSDFLNNKNTPEAKKEIVKWLVKTKNGKKAVDYKLRDWCISRQRYWGPPIPIIHCDHCGAVPVPEKDLPVKLPPMEDFLPEGKGKGPLAKNEKFVKTKCPQCGGEAKRDTDVSDPFLDSAWYFFRYPSTEFNDKIFDKARTKKWLPVDSYIGGKEHTVLHLLYSRFITMVLKDLGYVDFEEPYRRFFGHGLITKDGAKMSKSKGNVINPDEMIEKYGADTTRLYLRFLGDFSQGGDWRDTGADGMHRFVKKLWKLFYALEGRGKGLKNMNMTDKTIKVIGEDIEKLSFNTAVARLMEFVNWIKENEKDFNALQAKRIKQTLALLIAPMMPHLAEEFWSSLENKPSIFEEKWPKYNPKNIIENEIELVIQVNGKVRDKIMAGKNISEKEAQKIALESKKVQQWLKNQPPKKIIYVKGRLVNVVA